MRKHGIQANVRKKKHNRIQRHEEYISDNLLNEQFNRENKNEVWVTDTTEVVYENTYFVKHTRTRYFDLYGRYVLSSNISDTETSLASETFNRALRLNLMHSQWSYWSWSSLLSSSMFNDYLASNIALIVCHIRSPMENSPQWNAGGTTLSFGLDE